ncbi:MAG: agmatinase [Alphaproteobacteria bacterium]
MDFQKQGMSIFGVPSFVKAPVVQPDGDWRADIAALGVPFDLGTSYRSGTRFGPKAIRDWSTRFSILSTDTPGYWDIRSGTRRGGCRIVDCGDVDIVPLLWEENFERITRAVEHILARGARPVVLGGDHAITLPVLRAYKDRGPITVFQLDAHADYRDDSGGVRFGHGNVLRRVCELDHVEKAVCIGVRSLRQQQGDLADHKAHGNTLICAWDVHKHGVEHYRSALPSGKNVYVTFDIDAMDASIAPGTGTPEVGGLTYEQARRLLEMVCENNTIVGLDLVEVNPLFDPTNITALLANHLLIETLGFLFPG